MVDWLLHWLRLPLISEMDTEKKVNCQTQALSQDRKIEVSPGQPPKWPLKLIRYWQPICFPALGGDDAFSKGPTAFCEKYGHLVDS